MVIYDCSRQQIILFNTLHAGYFFKHLLSAEFSKLTVSKKIFRKIFSVNCLDPDQDRYSVGPDLGPNCLQRLSSKTTKEAAGKERVNFAGR